MKRQPFSPGARRERGVAALVVVMVLFFVVSLVAAYTNRNLIFEQRTSANLTRATQSFEAAQAGIDWAVAMVNGGRIDAACLPSANAGDTSFRDRYLTIDGTTGMITPRAKVTPSPEPGLSAACVFDGNTWGCSCPTDADPSPAVPAGDGTFPAFRVRLVQPLGAGAVPGVVRVESVACARFSMGAGSCLDFNNTGASEGRQFVSVLLAMNASVKTTPAAALTAHAAINVNPAATMNAYNSDIRSGGIAIQSGGDISLGITAHGPAGTPAAAAQAASDASLSGLTSLPPLLPTVEDRRFSTVFGVTPDDYKQQPAMVVLNGCPCGADALRNTILMNPGRPIWVTGDLAIDTAGDIGAANAPVAVIVDGDLTASVAATLYGVVYSRHDPWTISGNLRIQGAAVAEHGFAGTGGSTFVYDPAVLLRLRVTNGSLLPIPSSWRDFTP